MRTTGRLMWVLGGSFLTVDLAYVIWSQLAGNVELVGLMTIGLSGVLCLLLAFYFGRVVAANGESEWAEDRLDAKIDDGDPEVGFCSPWSWWPILLGAATALIFTGVAISAWIALIAAPFLIVCLSGWVFQYYRGYFAR
jgi:Cytochrome c oxidase subunit IV